MNKQKGFTLIELLVVIAIIGILSSVVLASLNTARSKGKDASAKGSLSAARASSELYYNDGTTTGGNNSYGSGAGATQTYTSTSVAPTPASTSVCTSADLWKLGQASAIQTGNSVVCTSNPTTYTLSTTLLDTTTFCVDGNGFSGKPSGAITAGVKCQ